MTKIYIGSDHAGFELKAKLIEYLKVLGHEIGHAVISHYFVVLPSVKVQEVLAVYVEYQLRKTER